MLTERKYPVSSPVRISALHTALEKKGLRVKCVCGEGEDADLRALSAVVISVEDEKTDNGKTIAQTVGEVNAIPLVIPTDENAVIADLLLRVAELEKKRADVL